MILSGLEIKNRIGKDIEIDFYNPLYGIMKNKPRLKSRSAAIYNRNT